MKIPNNFKDKIKSTFYDKVVNKVTVTSSVDDEGWIENDKIEIGSSFNGNVRFDDLAEVQENYGLQEVIDIVITTDEEIEVGAILEYGGIYYRAIKVIPHDSHNLILATKWSYQF